LGSDIVNLYTPTIYAHATERGFYECTFMLGEFQVREIVLSPMSESEKQAVESLALDFNINCWYTMGLYQNYTFALRGVLRINSSIPAEVLNCDAVDCVLSPWSDWVPVVSACVCSPDASITCLETRARSIILSPNQYGKQCELTHETRARLLPPCLSSENLRLIPSVYTHNIDPAYRLENDDRLSPERLDIMPDCEIMTESNFITGSLVKERRKIFTKFCANHWRFLIAAKAIDGEPRPNLTVGMNFIPRVC
jgi:hypothetical protein